MSNFSFGLFSFSASGPRTRRGVFGLATLALALYWLGPVMLAGCKRVEPPREAGAALRITATTGMVADIVARVAGERGAVRGLMGAGVDPHLYKPTRDDLEALMEADVIFYSGLMLEGKMGDTLVRVGRQKPVYAVTELIDEGVLLRDEENPDLADPHVWMDASLWALAVEVVGNALAEVDPSRADEYHERARIVAAECLSLHEYGTKIMATVPEERRVLISSHDAFGYFGRAYGVEVLGVQGMSTESEAGLRRINELVDTVVSRGIGAVFVETSVPRKSVEALIEGARARGATVRIGGTLFSDAMGPAGTYEGTYIGMLDHNLTTVARALGGEAPERGWGGKLSQPAGSGAPEESTPGAAPAGGTP
jgi:manganese/zinc/iron transport system substrate-binding protein